MSDLKNEIHDYWTNRARGYSEYNQQEMADARRTMWRDKLLSLLREAFPEREPGEIKILDVGTGPGFFAILLAEAGYQVTAIDYTEEMLREAQQNAGGLAKCITWKTGDAQALDVESNSFDAIVTRNVTWNLPRPDLAYKEWLRVLKPGGVLYNFDADWYGHLYNEDLFNAEDLDNDDIIAMVEDSPTYLRDKTTLGKIKAKAALEEEIATEEAIDDSGVITF